MKTGELVHYLNMIGDLLDEVDIEDDDWRSEEALTNAKLQLQGLVEEIERQEKEGS